MKLKWILSVLSVCCFVVVVVVVVVVFLPACPDSLL